MAKSPRQPRKVVFRVAKVVRGARKSQQPARVTPSSRERNRVRTRRTRRHLDDCRASDRVCPHRSRTNLTCHCHTRRTIRQSGAREFSSADIVAHCATLADVSSTSHRQSARCSVCALVTSATCPWTHRSRESSPSTLGVDG
jgi:hypothetical protein